MFRESEIIPIWLQESIKEEAEDKISSADEISIEEKFKILFQNDKKSESLSSSSSSSLVKSMTTKEEEEEKHESDKDEENFKFTHFTCIVCESPMASTQEEFWVCSNETCGYFDMNVLDSKAEWNTFGNDDQSGVDASRCGLPIDPFLPESSMSCKMSGGQGSSSFAMKRIRQIVNWNSFPHREKTQYNDYRFMTLMGTRGGIPKIVLDMAKHYHKKMLDQGFIFRGTNRQVILIVASVYFACRDMQHPRTLKEIANIFSVNENEATKGYNIALSILSKTEKDLESNEKTSVLWEKVTSDSFMDRFCSELQLNEELTQICKFISKIIQKFNMLPENTPTSITAGIISFVVQTCQLPIPTSEIEEITGLSGPTFKNCAKKINVIQKNNNMSLVPEALIQKYRVQRKTWMSSLTINGKKSNHVIPLNVHNPTLTSAMKIEETEIEETEKKNIIESKKRKNKSKA